VGTFKPVVHKDSIVSNLLLQYKTSTNLIKYLEVLTEPFDELEVVFANILNSRLLNEAKNKQLDIVGDLVTLPRGVYDPLVDLFFGMDADGGDIPVPHAGWGDRNDPTVGGILRSIEQPISGSTTLSDSMYLKAIKAKIIKNTCGYGDTDLFNSIILLLDEPVGTTGLIELTEPTGANPKPELGIKIHRTLTPTQKALLTGLHVLPRPGGMGYTFSDLSGTF